MVASVRYVHAMLATCRCRYESRVVIDGTGMYCNFPPKKAFTYLPTYLPYSSPSSSSIISSFSACLAIDMNVDTDTDTDTDIDTGQSGQRG